MRKKPLFKMIVLSFTAIVLIALTAFPLLAEYPVFYVCLVNNTNNNLNYTTEWCTRAGYDCTGSRKWSIAPGTYRTHWGSPGNGRMDVKIHTGGEGGLVKTYSFNGTADSCKSNSTFHIRYNDRGFLRIYDE